MCIVATIISLFNNSIDATLAIRVQSGGVGSLSSTPSPRNQQHATSTHNAVVYRPKLGMAMAPSLSKFKHIGQKEKRLLVEWFKEGKTVSEISELLGRDKSTIRRQVARIARGPGAPPRGVGRPAALSSKDVQRLIAKTKQMIKAADAEWQVTAAMIKRAAALTCCDRVVLDALHSHGIWMRPLREKPVLSTSDMRERKSFAEEFARKPASWWTKAVDAYIDNKFYPVYTDHKGRGFAAKRVAKGTFRAKGDGLQPGHVKPKRNLKYNTGAKSACVAAAISAEKVIMWKVIEGPWNGAAAASMYKDTLAPALRRQKPDRRRFRILEDNDPSGYKSRVGIAAKVAAKIDVVALPPRSPDLNPLDYGLWAAVNRRMRAQEKTFKPSFKESRCAHLARLRRVAVTMPASFLTPLVKSMERRCSAIAAANGGHIAD